MKSAILSIGAGAVIALSLTSASEASTYRYGAGSYASAVKALHANGFVSWREIERDDGKWEVDDARHHSGRVYDVDIRQGRIIKRERE